jgi:hypothetical protein
LVDVELPRVLVPGTALACRISRARMRTELRRGNWRAFARGAVLTRPEEPTRDDWAALGVALGGPTAALSGWDAVRAVGLGDRTDPPTEQVLVLSRHATNRVVGRVRVRQTDRPYSTHVTSAEHPLHPLTPIVSLARAIADASKLFDYLAPVRAMVTGAVQRKQCSVESLIAELNAGPRGGSRLLRLALADVMDGARSVAEAAAARRMTAARIPTFELNVPVLDSCGQLIAVVDVLWRGLRAVLEIDSREYHLSEQAWKRTMARHNRLTRLGLALTHLPPSEIHGRSWLADLAEWLGNRSRELGVHLPAGHGVIRPPGGHPRPYVLPNHA